MSSSSQDLSATPPKKTSNMFEKLLGQKIPSFKDMADNLERRKQTSNQVHFVRTQTSEDSLSIEKKPVTPPEIRQRSSATKDEENSSTNEKTFSITQLAMSLGKKVTNERAELVSASSYQDLFSCDNRLQAKEMIINGVRQDVHHNHLKRIRSEPSSMDERTSKLLAGPKFRRRVIEFSSSSTNDFKREKIYPIGIAVGLISLFLALWKPISSFFSGILVGFLMAVAIAYLLLQCYSYSNNDGHEWIDFTDLETMFQEKMTKSTRETNLNTCGEIVFGRYDPDHDEEFVRYPVVIRLDNYRLIIQLPTKSKTDEKKDKEMKFVGFREYLVKEANVILVPEATLTRIKYWLDEYPIVLQNLQLLDKQMMNKQSLEKLKFDVEDFFNNPQTTISLFFETGPDKEEWFHKLSLILRKGKEDIERANRLRRDSASMSSSSSLPTISTSHADLHRSNTIHVDDRPSMPNESDIINEMTQTKKKLRKEDENLQKLLDSPDCLDEAALTLNFLLRRMFCDVFEDPLFENLLKEKIELKLKEIALTVLDDLHVETIEMGNTFPIILKVEPMQWNNRGLWFKVFLVYRGSFKTTIKTRIILKRLVSNTITTEPPVLYAQQHSVQIVHKDDEQIDEDDIAQRQKLSTKETEVPESVASRKLGLILTKVAANKHFQRFAALKPVADVMEKLSASEFGVNIELLNITGLMTINIPPPPSDRVWIGFSEMPDLNLKVTPVFGDNKYSYTFIHDFLEARIREEIKRLLVFPAMDDQLLPFMRDWVLDVIGSIVSKSPQMKNKCPLQQSISEEKVDI